MINFQRLGPARKAEYDRYLMNCGQRGCEYSFANLYMWGRQEAAFLGENLVFFSQFDRRSVYPFPILRSDPKAVLDAIMDDAHARKIRCRITSLLPEDCRLLEQLYPGKFHFYADRDSYDYVYAIDDLAELKGRKFQKKRNHFNRFQAEHPEYTVQPLDGCNMIQAQCMVDEWYARRLREDPHGDYLLENIAMARAFRSYGQLAMEGLVLEEHGRVLAVTMGSRLAQNTFDIHFEKAREDVEGAYAAINCEFARYLRLKYPQVRYLDREDDLGLEGLRKAKLSYNPCQLLEKSWAYLQEDVRHD